MRFLLSRDTQRTKGPGPSARRNCLSEPPDTTSNVLCLIEKQPRTRGNMLRGPPKVPKHARKECWTSLWNSKVHFRELAGLLAKAIHSLAEAIHTLFNNTISSQTIFTVHGLACNLRLCLSPANLLSVLSVRVHLAEMVCTKWCCAAKWDVQTVQKKNCSFFLKSLPAVWVSISLNLILLILRTSLLLDQSLHLISVLWRLYLRPVFPLSLEIPPSYITTHDEKIRIYNKSWVWNAS